MKLGAPVVAGVGVVNGIGGGVVVGVGIEVGEIERVEEWKSELKQKSTRSCKSAYDLVGDNKKSEYETESEAGQNRITPPPLPPIGKNVERNLVNSLNRWSPQTCSDGINF